MSCAGASSVGAPCVGADAITFDKIVGAFVKDSADSVAADGICVSAGIVSIDDSKAADFLSGCSSDSPNGGATSNGCSTGSPSGSSSGCEVVSSDNPADSGDPGSFRANNDSC